MELLAGVEDDAANGRNVSRVDEKIADPSGSKDDGRFAQYGSSKRPLHDGPPHGKIDKLVIVGMRVMLNFFRDGIIRGACFEQCGVDIRKEQLEFAPTARKKCVRLLEVSYTLPGPVEGVTGIVGDLEGIAVEEEHGVFCAAEAESRRQSCHSCTNHDDLHGRKL
jgi:hypothetical protein